MYGLITVIHAATNRTKPPGLARQDVPPDPGSAHTSNIRNPQILSVCRYAHYQQP